MADRRYETLVLIHPEQGEQGAKELTNRIRSLIEDQKGSIGQIQEWGLRDLAFLVAKQRRAFYVLFEYRATPAALAEVERNLRLTDPVLRFVSVRQAENAPPTPDRTVRRPEPEESDTSLDAGDTGDMESLGEEM
jgi:small subunit ribosomal protein S6